MSYDLYFYKRKGQEISKNGMEEYLTSQKVGIPDDAPDIFYYHNKNTGTYFSVERQKEEPDIGTIKNNGEYEYLGYLFNLNFLRPDFFGKESFDVIDAFIEKFDLSCLDFTSPHEDHIFNPVRGELYKTWSQINEEFSLKEEVAKNLLYYPLEKMEKDWVYNNLVQEWQNELGDTYFVPSIFYFRKKGYRQMFTVTTWTHHIPTVLPPVDYVILNKQVKTWLSVKDKSGIVSYKTLMEKLGEYFADFKEKDGRILTEENSAKIGDIFNNLPFEENIDSFERVGVDVITNAKK